MDDPARPSDESELGPADEGYDEAWTVELRRRTLEIREGKAKLVDADLAFTELRAKYPRK